jgi:hypothetical protein
MNRHIHSCEDSSVAEFSHTNLVCLNILRLTIIVRGKSGIGTHHQRGKGGMGSNRQTRNYGKKAQAIEFLIFHTDDCEQEIMKKSLKSLQFNPLFSFEQSGSFNFSSAPSRSCSC